MTATVGLVCLAAVVGAPGGSAASLGGTKVPGFETATITPAAFRTLHAATAPGGDTERWTQIPWQSDLRAAQKLAAREQKPLLMWIMDGHPLGCT